MPQFYYIKLAELKSRSKAAHARCSFRGFNTLYVACLQTQQPPRLHDLLALLQHLPVALREGQTPLLHAPLREPAATRRQNQRERLALPTHWRWFPFSTYKTFVRTCAGPLWATCVHSTCEVASGGGVGVLNFVVGSDLWFVWKRILLCALCSLSGVRMLIPVSFTERLKA